MRPRYLVLAAIIAPILLALAADPASAHHVMGKRPETFAQGVLSGLGHPIIGLDHLAAVIAVGCLAALYRIGALLAIGFVLAVIAGVAVHVQGATFPGVELLVALSVVVLGACLVWRRVLPPAVALGLFVLAGLLHGYALGESIVGAEPAPLYAYFIGLAVMQSAIAQGARRWCASSRIRPGATRPRYASSAPGLPASGLPWWWASSAQARDEP